MYNLRKCLHLKGFNPYRCVIEADLGGSRLVPIEGDNSTFLDYNYYAYIRDKLHTMKFTLRFLCLT